MTPEQGKTRSAGETGEAKEASSPRAEIIIGEIPSVEDLTTMLWTARCTEATHDLLGHFDTRSQAEEAGAHHLQAHHRTL
jgi:hypothetical protein